MSEAISGAVSEESRISLRSSGLRSSPYARRFGSVKVDIQRQGWAAIMALEIFTLRERPDVRPLIFSSDLQSVWPEFMRHDAAAQLYFALSMFDRYLDYAFAGVAGGLRLPIRSSRTRHCERSEAIHVAAWRMDGLLRRLRSSQ
jgi:hypothetical protein